MRRATATQAQSPQSPSARSFCALHPAGVGCQYCTARPSAVTASRKGHTHQAVFNLARTAQRAYWDAMAQLELVANLQLDWSDCDLTEYTLAQLSKEFPAKGK